MPDRRPLGRLEPTDRRHEALYPLRASPLAEPPPVVERVLSLPNYLYDQGVEGACCGFSASWLCSILNRRKYAARWLYLEAQKVDEWPGTAYEGTSVRATMDVLRKVGHRRSQGWYTYPAGLTEGIAENRWARDSGEVRAAIGNGAPVVLGIDWYSNFDGPVKHNGEWWIGKGHLGNVRGGHAICCYGASDERQAVKLVNSWGKAYPTVWVAYSLIDRLIMDGGEGAVVTDRV